MRPPLGLRAEDPTIAELLKPHGYATGQFGKNHLGDRNEFLPTVHGFDEFFGNLYHLNAEEDPESPNYPFPRGLPALPGAVRAPRRPALLGERGGRRHRGVPRGARRQAADRVLGAVDAQAHGDDRHEVLEHALDFIDRQHAAGTPFFVWFNTTPAGAVSNEIIQHHDWLPTFLAAAGEPDVIDKLRAGHQVGDRTYKVHIDGSTCCRT
jgi:arylsulfatase